MRASAYDLPIFVDEEDLLLQPIHLRHISEYVKEIGLAQMDCRINLEGASSCSFPAIRHLRHSLIRHIGTLGMCGLLAVSRDDLLILVL
jgi:hypothetical protein